MFTYSEDFLYTKAEVGDRLEQILARQCQIEAKMSGIGRTLNNLAAIENDSKNISKMITHTGLKV